MSNSHSSAIADHMTQTGHRINKDNFEILATVQRISAIRVKNKSKVY